MKIEEEIKQTTFRNAYQKAALNIIYSGNWLLSKQQEFFKPFGITSSQFNILRILRGQHPHKISGVEIKSRMLDRNSDIPRLLDRLIRKNLISKSQCPNDKRAADVMITAKGLEILELIDTQIHESEKTLLKLTKEEATQLSNLLDKCRD
ncbi:MAG: MarR family transcriptional regulator [Cyclobacteriaceae bacterium]|nr:MarR family transcriptional regulator [Cyclobacteriaceae bacterium]